MFDSGVPAIEDHDPVGVARPAAVVVAVAPQHDLVTDLAAGHVVRPRAGHEGDTGRINGEVDRDGAKPGQREQGQDVRPRLSELDRQPVAAGDHASRRLGLSVYDRLPADDVRTDVAVSHSRRVHGGFEHSVDLRCEVRSAERLPVGEVQSLANLEDVGATVVTNCRHGRDRIRHET